MRFLAATRDLKSYYRADCRDMYRPSLMNQVIVIDKEALPPRWNTGRYQLWYCVGGNGSALGEAKGAVQAVSLFTGEVIIWDRAEVEGILRPDMLPPWAAAKHMELRLQQ